VMGMHFKLGLYEHQSAGALQGLIDLISANPAILEHPETIKEIRIVAYEPAFGIIGDPAKRDPRTRQSADHSMVYIVSTMLRKAIDLAAKTGTGAIADGNDSWWKALMLLPEDYGRSAIVDNTTRSLMDLIAFEHGGEEYDSRYPDGIPTSVVITLKDGTNFDSGLVMYPSGHARNTAADLEDILSHKSDMLGSLAMDDPSQIIARFNNIASLSVGDVQSIMDFEICQRDAID